MDEEAAKKAQTLEARARSISQNVRCTECGSQSIEDSQADVAILLRKLIRDEVRAGKTDKEIFKKLEHDFGETVLYVPRFDMQTAAIWLSPGNLIPVRMGIAIFVWFRYPTDFFMIAGAAAGVWAYQKHRHKNNVHIMALNLLRGVALTPRERETMLDILTPPLPQRRKWGF